MGDLTNRVKLTCANGPQGPTSSYEKAHEKENPTLKYTYSYEDRTPAREIYVLLRGAREEKKAKPTPRDTYP